MNAWLRIYSILFLPLLLFSCKQPRDGQTTSQGQVRDLHTGAAVANATVSLMRNKVSSSSAAYSFVQSWQADENGNFEFGFEGDEDYSYVLMASTPLGYYTPWNNAPRLTSGRKNKELKVPAQAPAWVRVNLVDESPLGTIRFSIWGFKDDFYGPIYPIADTSFVKRVDGGIESSIHYAINNASGNAPIHHVSVSPNALDTTSITIQF
jgi:hypothetical protein